MKLPGSSDVRRSLSALKKDLRDCLRQVNAKAGALMAKGDYEGAEALMKVAKGVDAFRLDVDGLSGKWRELASAATREDTTKSERTPLWQYYHPILRALTEMGGTARLHEIQASVAKQMNGRLKPGDSDTMARGRLRWQAMVRRARKPLVEQGFLEADPGLEWRITTAGRKAAASGKVREE